MEHILKLKGDEAALGVAGDDNSLFSSHLSASQTGRIGGLDSVCESFSDISASFETSSHTEEQEDARGTGRSTSVPSHIYAVAAGNSAYRAAVTSASLLSPLAFALNQTGAAIQFASPPVSSAVKSVLHVSTAGTDAGLLSLPVVQKMQGAETLASLELPLASARPMVYELTLSPGNYGATASASEFLARIAQSSGENMVLSTYSSVSLGQAIAQGVQQAAERTATALQAVYDSLAFVIGNEESPFAPIFDPINDATGLKGHMETALTSLPEESYFEAPIVKNPVTGVPLFNPNTLTAGFGGENTYIFASGTRQGDPSEPNPDANDMRGQVELSLYELSPTKHPRVF